MPPGELGEGVLAAESWTTVLPLSHGPVAMDSGMLAMSTPVLLVAQQAAAASQVTQETAQGPTSPFLVTGVAGAGVRAAQTLEMVEWLPSMAAAEVAVAAEVMATALVATVVVEGEAAY